MRVYPPWRWAKRGARCFEQLGDDGRILDKGQRLAPRVEILAFSQRDHPLRNGANCLGAGQGCSDTLLVEERRHHVAEHAYPMGSFSSPAFLPATRCLMNPVSDLLQRSSRYSGFGAATGLPSASSFIPKDKPISESISLISFRDLRPKFLVLSISASVFWTSSPIVLISAFFRQL